MRKITVPRSDGAAWLRSRPPLRHLAPIFALILLVTVLVMQLTSGPNLVRAMSGDTGLQTGSNPTGPAIRNGTASPERPAVTVPATWQHVYLPNVIVQRLRPVVDVQPTLPLRAAFYYPWFPESWTQLGVYPYTNYSPSLGYYNSSDQATIRQHIAAMQYGGIRAGILSWWGQGSPTDGRVAGILAATSGSAFRWGIYYEAESTGDPSVSALSSDLVYLRDHYGSDPGFLRIGGRFVVFAFADSADGCAMADRWQRANTVNAYIVLKVVPGYEQCASQPDGWHQYGPAAAADGQGGYSYTISPGFWKSGETTARLARDPVRWRQNIRDMVASGSRFQLITAFNEWGEGTSVESASLWTSGSGYGVYLDALHNNGAEPH